LDAGKKKKCFLNYIKKGMVFKMEKCLVLSNDSYGRNNVVIALREKDIEMQDLHDLCEMLIMEHGEVVEKSMDFLGEDIIEAEDTYKEDYTEDYTLLYYNGGEKMYAFRMRISELTSEEVDLWV
jgi:hypothetical protein